MDKTAEMVVTELTLQADTLTKHGYHRLAERVRAKARRVARRMPKE